MRYKYILIYLNISTNREEKIILSLYLCTSAHLKLETGPNRDWAIAPHLEVTGTVVQPVYLLKHKMVSQIAKTDCRENWQEEMLTTRPGVPFVGFTVYCLQIFISKGFFLSIEFKWRRRTAWKGTRKTDSNMNVYISQNQPWHINEETG